MASTCLYISQGNLDRLFGVAAPGAITLPFDNWKTLLLAFYAALPPCVRANGRKGAAPAACIQWKVLFSTISDRAVSRFRTVHFPLGMLGGQLAVRSVAAGGAVVVILCKQGSGLVSMHAAMPGACYTHPAEKKF